MNFGLRVWRRSDSKTILIWNQSLLPDDCREVSNVFVDDDTCRGPLKCSKFVPDNPEKFAKDVDGKVIPHAINGLDPLKLYVMRVVFGVDDETVEASKEVKPVGAIPVRVPEHTQTTNIVHVYGMDYATGKWIPFPVTLPEDD
jgi:hypothetical protein